MSGQQNPFRELRDDTYAVIEEMLEAIRENDLDDFDRLHGWIDQYREARGEAHMGDWRWWIGEVDGECYVLDFATREEAVAAAPRAIRMGDLPSEDGRFWICKARCWNDMFNEGDEVFPFARQTPPEVETVTPESANDVR